VFLLWSVLLIFLVFCVVFLVGSVLLIFLVFYVLFLVGSVLLIFLKDEQHRPHQKHNTEN
jgi:fatty acid desaturase